MTTNTMRAGKADPHIRQPLYYWLVRRLRAIYTSTPESEGSRYMNGNDRIYQLPADLSSLLAYLDNSYLHLEEFGSYVAVSKDRSTIFTCPMDVSGSPERHPYDSRHMNWAEVCAPEPEFLDQVNEHFGTAFQIASFSGR
jgi:hypothetical protein